MCRGQGHTLYHALRLGGCSTKALAVFAELWFKRIHHLQEGMSGWVAAAWRASYSAADMADMADMGRWGGV